MESRAPDYRTARVTKPLDGSPLLLCTSHIVIVSFWHGELGFLAAVAKARRALRRRSESHPFSDRLCGDLVSRGPRDPDCNNAVVVSSRFSRLLGPSDGFVPLLSPGLSRPDPHIHRDSGRHGRYRCRARRSLPNYRATVRAMARLDHGLERSATTTFRRSVAFAIRERAKSGEVISLE